MFRPSSTLKPVIYDVNPEEYHAPQKAARGTPEFVMSRSELEKFNICASKWKRNGYVQPETQALVWGGLMDVVVLTPDILESAYVTYPETYKKVMMQCPDCGGVADSKKCKACNKPRIQSEVEMAWDLHSSTCRKWALDRRAEGKIPIKAEMMSDAWAANARLKEDEEIMAILECSKKQVQLNLEWHCEDTGIVVPWKMLLDIVPAPSSEFGNTIYDFKTSRNLDRRKWKLQVFNDNLHLLRSALPRWDQRRDRTTILKLRTHHQRERAALGADRPTS